MAHKILAMVGFGFAFAQPAPEYPTPPIQTQTQKSVYAQKQVEAKAASDAATPRVLALLGSAQFRSAIHDCCPEASVLPADKLLERFRAEVRSAELAHAFNAGGPKTNTGGHHFTVALGMRYDWFINSYQAGILQENAANRSAVPLPNIGDQAERDIYGCPSWKVPAYPSWDEASDRMVYVANNLRQQATGSNHFFGDTTAIFRRSHVKDMVLMAPVDTGTFEKSCNPLFKNDPSFPLPPEFPFDCSKWQPSIVGTLDYHDHIILPNLELWQSRFGTIYQEAAELFGRSAFAGNYSRLPALSIMGNVKYYEANLLGNPRFPEALRFLIASFQGLFGTASGKLLQAFADKYNWPLVWTFTPDGLDRTQRPRVLDPTVAASKLLNLTLSPKATADFNARWDIVSTTLFKHKGSWEGLWHLFSAEQVSLAPLTLANCADVDECIGTELRSGSCVCKTIGTASDIVV